MKRSRVLLGVVLLIAGSAIALRLRSQFTRRREPAPATRPVSGVGPRDYVVDPWVHPDEVDRGPQRVVSLAPSITEIVCALGLRDRLAGRTQFCRHPPDVASVPVVGALMDTNFELIESIAPDLVLATSNSGRVIDGLARLGIPCTAVPHNTLEEVYTAIELVGDACHRPRTAGGLVASIRADVSAVAAAARAANHAPLEVLISLGELPATPRPVWVAGPGMFLDELLRLTGHRNAAAAVLREPVAELPLETLVTLDVDVIVTFGPALTGRQRADLCQAWSDVGPIRAIRERRVVRVGGSEWLSAGPRVAIALHRLAERLRNPDDPLISSADRIQQAGP